jgi:hypothetical protein
MLRHITAILISAVFIVSAPAARAGDGSCVWNHFPADTKQRALAAGLEHGPKALADSIPRDQSDQAESDCGITSHNSNALRRAESGYMLQLLAERWLADNAGLSANQLNDAWTKMDDAAKSGMERWVVTFKYDPDAYDAAYHAFLVALGNPANLPTDVKRRIVFYI